MKECRILIKSCYAIKFDNDLTDYVTYKRNSFNSKLIKKKEFLL